MTVNPPSPPSGTASRYADLTNTVAETVALPEKGQVFVRDLRLPGFALRVTSGGIKSWIVEARLRGAATAKRRTIGRYPAVKADRARTLAMQELGRFAEGQDRLVEERTAKIRAITLGEVFEDYLKHRDLKPVTVADYQKLMESHFADWKDRQITSITRSMVERRHADDSAKSKARANLAMRLLRALINFAIGKYEDGEGNPVLVDNPIKRLNAVRSWNRIERRRSLVRLHQMKAWFDALDQLRQAFHEVPESYRPKLRMSLTAADWLEFIMLTGCRYTESRHLIWENVDLNAKFFRIPDTKNRMLHELPLSDRLHELLTSRLPSGQDPPMGYVFPGENPGKPISDLRRWVNWVIRESGVDFTPHDLRRTFATVAEGLDLPTYTLKRLLNHLTGTDVTAGYIQIDVERLRVPMQRITDAILTAAGRRGTPAKVIEFPSAKVA